MCTCPWPLSGARVFPCLIMSSTPLPVPCPSPDPNHRQPAMHVYANNALNSPEPFIGRLRLLLLPSLPERCKLATGYGSSLHA